MTLKGRRPKRHRSATTWQERPAAGNPNERWCMDFMGDTLADGRRLRVLTVLETCTRECLALEVGSTFRGSEVAAILTRLGGERGSPWKITCDHGTEFTSKSLDHWAYRNGVRLGFTRPGNPTDSAYIESSNSRVRKERLARHWFLGLADAQRTLATWTEECNNHRAYSALGNQTPVGSDRLGEHFGPDRRRLQKLRA